MTYDPTVYGTAYGFLGSLSDNMLTALAAGH